MRVIGWLGLTLVTALGVGSLLAACSDAEREELRRQAELAAETAVAEAGKAAETKAVEIRETAVALATERGPEIRQTAGAAIEDAAGSLRQTVEAVATEQGPGLRQTLEAAAGRGLGAARATAAAALATRLAPRGGTREFPDTARGDDVSIGAHYYVWWGPGRRHWQEGYRGSPTLGEYGSSDTAVIDKHIDWATGHGVDLMAFSWWGPDSPEDKVLRDAWPAARLSGDMRHLVVYESAGRLRATDGRIDLGDAGNRQILRDDFAYLAGTYWDRPGYLKVDGRPVVVLYLSRTFTGDIAGALDALRAAARAGGHEVYLIGDEVFWQQFQPIDPQRLRLFDGITAYNMHASVPGIEQDFTFRVGEEYQAWRQAATAAGVAFVPGVIPGFDDSAVRPEERHPPIPRSPDLLRAQLDMALPLADPRLKMVLVTSWNEWHEDTSIEPAAEFGFTYLDALQAALDARR